MSQTTFAGRLSLPENGGSQKLTQFSLENLMSALDSERNRAGEKYQRLHRRLVKWFEARGTFVAEELADETLDRVARKLSEEEIQNIPAYTSGWHGTF